MASFTSAAYLGLGALVGDTIRLLRIHWRPFVLVAIAVLVPLGLLDAALGQLSQSGAVTDVLQEIDETGIQWQAVKNMLLSAWAWGLAAGLLVSALVHPLLDGVLVRVASQVIRGEAHDLLEDLGYAARRWWRILLARLLLLGAAIFALGAPFGCIILAVTTARLLGSSSSDGPASLPLTPLMLMVPVALVVVVVLFAIGIRLGFVTHAIIVEDHGTMAGIRRSWELTQGQIWRLLGYAIVLAIVVLPVGLIVSLLDAVVPWIDGLNIGGWITVPFDAIANTLIFYGLRAEAERYRSVRAPATPASANP